MIMSFNVQPITYYREEASVSYNCGTLLTHCNYLFLFCLKIEKSYSSCSNSTHTNIHAHTYVYTYAYTHTHTHTHQLSIVVPFLALRMVMLSCLHQQLFNRLLHTAVMKGMTSLVILFVCVRVMVTGLSLVSVILPAKVMN